MLPCSKPRVVGTVQEQVGFLPETRFRNELVKLLHTSDWHLGRTLYGRTRYQEFSAFLDWLAELIREESVDLLLVAGDVFDTITPGTRAQELYYRFLHQVADSGCRHVVIIGGNHDSPSFLDAPKNLLRFLNVHVFGAVTGDLHDEILVLYDRAGIAEAVVCAVPYLRDRDIRSVEAGESMEDKNRKLLEGIGRHYAEVCRIASEIRSGFDCPVPLLALGHLFTAGGMTVEEDGVREVYVGSLAHVDRAVFPSDIDYLALGHLHVPQKVGGVDHLRYSGSPIPMGFGEAGQQKVVLLAEFAGTEPQVTAVSVPCFQPLLRLSGSLDELSAGIMALKAVGSSAWLEIAFTGSEPASMVRETLDDAVCGSSLEIRRVRNNRVVAEVLRQLSDEVERLEELDPEEVFLRLLDMREHPESMRPELLQCYREVLCSIDEADHMLEQGSGRAEKEPGAVEERQAESEKVRGA